MRSKFGSVLARQPARVRARRLNALSRLKAAQASGAEIGRSGKFIWADEERMAQEIAVLEKRTAGGS